MSQSEHDRRIDYIEFPVADVAVAKRFYTAVFGWAFTDYGPDYTSFADGRLSGGFRGGEAAVPGGPLVVIYAADLAAAESAVIAAGGRITQPIFAFPGGRRFHFRDPCGHELAVWSDPIAGEKE
jgi:predicted enzyme related to lactoylglutathione lyase